MAADPTVGHSPYAPPTKGKKVPAIQAGLARNYAKQKPLPHPSVTGMAKTALDYSVLPILGVKASDTNVAKAVHGDLSGFKNTLVPPHGGAGRVNAGVVPFGPLKGLLRGAKAEAVPEVPVVAKPDVAQPIRDALAGKTNATKNMTNAEKAAARVDDPLLGASAKRLRAEQEKGYSAVRAKRIDDYEKALKDGLAGGLDPEDAHRIAMHSLAGELPKLEFTAGKELSRDTLPQLFSQIQEHPGLGKWERVRTREALKFILDGKVPTKSEIRLLTTVFGEHDANALAGSAGFWKQAGNMGLQLLNVPRALKSSYDLSAPFRQGLVLGARHPKMFAAEFGPMMKSFASEKAYKGVMDEIASRPTFEAMQDSKLALTDLGNITSREEAFASNIAEIVPGVRASGRAYVAFLNKFRADAFDNYLKMAEAQGSDITDPKVTASIARWVNYATGRGGQSKFLSNHAVGLNATFFSPRLIASRVNLLANPKFYADLDPFARKQALQGMAQLIGGVSLTLWLAKMAGAKVGVDPRSADFGKIRVGNTRVDILGGFQQYIVFGARMLKGETLSSSTGKVEHLTGGFGKASRGTLVSRLAQQKFAPIPAYAAGWANNENYAGQPFHPGKEAALLLAPLGPLNAGQTYQQGGAGAAAIGFGLGSVGFGVQSYGTPKKKGGGSSATSPYASGGTSGGSPYSGSSAGAKSPYAP